MAPAAPSLNAIIGRLRARHLLLIDALGETRNVGRAAARTHMTQSAATKLLADVEELFGAALFERSKRGMLPTAVGTALIARARRMLAEIGRAHDEIAAISDGQLGVVRVGAFSLAAAVLVPRTLLRLAEEAPHLTIQLQEGQPDVLLTALKRGELDLVVGRIPRDAPGIAFEKICDQLVCVVAGPNHVLAKRRRVTWAMAAQHRWVLPPHGGAGRAALDETLAQAGLTTPPATVETMSLVATEVLVEEGLMALMPYDVARHLAAGGRAVILPLRLDVPLPAIGVAWEAGAEPGPHSRQFLTALRQEAARMA